MSEVYAKNEHNQSSCLCTTTNNSFKKNNKKWLKN